MVVAPFDASQCRALRPLRKFRAACSRRGTFGAHQIYTDAFLMFFLFDGIVGFGMPLDR